MAYVTNPATLRLAVWVSLLGVAAAVALDAVGVAAQPLLVVAIMIVGMTTSSIRTNRLPRATAPVASRERVAIS